MGTFALVFNEQQEAVHKTAREKGWWDEKRNDGEMIALMHSELSEALEALRTGQLSDHVPELAGVEEELADVVIRIMDFAEAHGWDVGAAIELKAQFNTTRPHKHGKKF